MSATSRNGLLKSLAFSGWLSATLRNGLLIDFIGFFGTIWRHVTPGSTENIELSGTIWRYVVPGFVDFIELSGTIWRDVTPGSRQFCRSRSTFLLGTFSGRDPKNLCTSLISLGFKSSVAQRTVVVGLFQVGRHGWFPTLFRKCRERLVCETLNIISRTVSNSIPKVLDTDGTFVSSVPTRNGAGLVVVVFPRPQARKRDRGATSLLLLIHSL